MEPTTCELTRHTDEGRQQRVRERCPCGIDATIPLGDGESLERLRERTEDTVAHPAGSTALVDASIPPASQPESGQEPGGGTPGS